MRICAVVLVVLTYLAGTGSSLEHNDSTTETSLASTNEVVTTLSTENYTLESTTTADITTSTSHAPTTIVPPMPVPANPPIMGPKWMVRNSVTNVTCIILQLAGRFTATYNATDNKSRNAYFDIPTNSSLGTVKAAADACMSSTNQTIEIAFRDPNSLLKTLRMDFLQTRPIDKQEYHISKWTITYRRPPGAVSALYTAVRQEKDSQTGHRYSALCKSKQGFAFPPDVQLETNHFQVQAFRNNTRQGFSTAARCDPDLVTNNTVPIAVGVALAGLVIVVLIAYIINRVRTNKPNYNTV